MTVGRRKPKLKKSLRLFMDLPREVCPACSAEFLIRDCVAFPKHNLGDTPDWFGDGTCKMSEKPIRRRQPRERKTMVTHYREKQKQYKDRF